MRGGSALSFAQKRASQAMSIRRPMMKTQSFRRRRRENEREEGSCCCEELSWWCIHKRSDEVGTGEGGRWRQEK